MNAFRNLLLKWGIPLPGNGNFIATETDELWVDAPPPPPATTTTIEVDGGEASIYIHLRDGDITVRHGQDDELLARLDNAPDGTWDRIWFSLDAIGFERTL